MKCNKDQRSRIDREKGLHPSGEAKNVVDDRWIEDLEDELGCFSLSGDEIPAITDELGLMDPARPTKLRHERLGL
jgi:hypothetical protein